MRGQRKVVNTYQHWQNAANEGEKTKRTWTEDLRNTNENDQKKKKEEPELRQISCSRNKFIIKLFCSLRDGHADITPNPEKKGKRLVPGKRHASREKGRLKTARLY